MVFSSLAFLFLFLPVCLAVNAILPKGAQNYWLLLFSLVFYGWGAHSFLLVMVLSIALNYCFAMKIAEAREDGRPRMATFWLCADLAANLGILFYNKYMNFVTSNLHRIFGDSITVTKIALPIGISFFTFQAISYAVDVYRGDVQVQSNPFKLGLFISLFPQLIAGPIVRYHTIAEQIERRTVTAETFYQGIMRFIRGFCFKILLANSFAIVADAAFDVKGSQISPAMAWWGAICYTLQIYFDFSGYSDMAIGLGKMLGFRFQENFNYPYIAKTVSEFWRRWHISLGQFFRDYVYFPLGGSRVKSKARLAFNLFVVWFLTGVWHGASWHFIFWGLWYYLLIAAEKLLGIPGRLPKPLKRCYRAFTLLAVVLGWVLFRCTGMAAFVQYIKAMLGLQGVALVDSLFLRYFIDYWRLFVIALFFATPLWERCVNWLRRRVAGEVAVQVGSLVFLLLAVSSLVMGGHNPFIYFNF